MAHRFLLQTQLRTCGRSAWPTTSAARSRAAWRRDRACGLTLAADALHCNPACGTWCEDGVRHLQGVLADSRMVIQMGSRSRRRPRSKAGMARACHTRNSKPTPSRGVVSPNRLPMAIGTRHFEGWTRSYCHLLTCRNPCKKTQGCWRLQQQAVEPESRSARVLGTVTESVRSRLRKRSAPGGDVEMPGVLSASASDLTLFMNRPRYSRR